jgi:hypothetical protein
MISSATWWRRALEPFGTFKGKHCDALTREDAAEYREQKAREELPVTDPERHLGLRMSRLEDIPKGWWSIAAVVAEAVAAQRSGAA